MEYNVCDGTHDEKKKKKKKKGKLQCIPPGGCKISEKQKLLINIVNLDQQIHALENDWRPAVQQIVAASNIL